MIVQLFKRTYNIVLAIVSMIQLKLKSKPAPQISPNSHGWGGEKEPIFFIDDLDLAENNSTTEHKRI
jgi:hypothetical protein